MTVLTDDYAAMEEALCDYIIAQDGPAASLGNPITVDSTLITVDSTTLTVDATATGVRLWPNSFPQTYRVSQGAACCYEIISSVEEHVLSDRCGLVHSRVQFTCAAATLKSAILAARRIKNCGITSLKGTYQLVYFCGIRIESGIRTYAEPPTDGQGLWRYLAEFDVIVSYLEA